MMDKWEWRHKDDSGDEETGTEVAEETAESTDEISSSDSCADRLAAAEEALRQSEERYLRVLADMENVRRRAIKEKEDAVKFGNAALARDLLAFVDNLERALQCAPSPDRKDAGSSDLSPDVAAFVQGVQLVAKDVIDVLERHGIRKMVSTGQPFDPAVHQAVSEVPSGGEEAAGIVKETLQTGYTLNGRLLRAAMVVVTK